MTRTCGGSRTTYPSMRLSRSEPVPVEPVPVAWVVRDRNGHFSAPARSLLQHPVLARAQRGAESPAEGPAAATYCRAAILAWVGRLLFGPPGDTRARRYELLAYHLLPSTPKLRKSSVGGQALARTPGRGLATGHLEGRGLEIFPSGHEASTVRPYLREAEHHRRASGAGVPHAFGRDHNLQVATVRR